MNAAKPQRGRGRNGDLATRIARAARGSLIVRASLWLLRNRRHLDNAAAAINTSMTPANSSAHVMLRQQGFQC